MALLQKGDLEAEGDATFQQVSPVIRNEGGEVLVVLVDFAA